MSLTTFMQLPTSVKVTFAVLAWPAIWAAALMCLTLGGDIIRSSRKRALPAAARAMLER